MEDLSLLIKYLIRLAESYFKTNLELVKMKAVSNATDIAASIMTRIIKYVVILIVVFLFSVGLSLWIGDLVGKSYYGFFIVAALNVLIAMIIRYKPNFVKMRVKDSLIVKILNRLKDEKELS